MNLTSTLEINSIKHNDKYLLWVWTDLKPWLNVFLLYPWEWSFVLFNPSFICGKTICRSEWALFSFSSFAHSALIWYNEYEMSIIWYLLSCLEIFTIWTMKNTWEINLLANISIQLLLQDHPPLLWHLQHLEESIDGIILWWGWKQHCESIKQNYEKIQ